jgi:tetratricopeptide (TPR) repeat protein
MLLVLVAPGILLAQPRPKAGYDLWAKERIRFLLSKVDRDPHAARLRVLLANALYADGRRQEAKVQLEEAVRLEPDLVEAHCNLAVILHHQGRAELARYHYEQALRLDSTVVAARAGLGTLLCRTGDRAAGLAHLELVVASHPHETAARYNMAVAYHKAGDFQRAMQHLEILLEADPNYPGGRLGMARACYGLGVQLLDAKQTEAAVVAVDRALLYEQGDERMFYAKGLAHLARAEYPSAEEAFRRAVALQSDHVPALHNLGAVCEHLGRDQEALVWYQRVRDLSPHLATIEAVKGAHYDVTFLLR